MPSYNINLSEISPRIQTIYNEFYSGASREKYINLFFEYQNYIEKHIKLDDKFSAIISDVDLFRAIDSYFIDVIRYKEYHFDFKSSPNYEDDKVPSVYSKEWTHKIHAEERINFQKIAALTVKWLLKTNIIQIKRDDNEFNNISKEENEEIAFANVRFILHHAFSLLNVDIRKVPSQFIKEIYYNFKFRNYDENHYFLIFGILADAYGEKNEYK